jgi:uncharacterized membrane protein
MQVHPGAQTLLMSTELRVMNVSELIVLGFEDPYRASEVLSALLRRQWDWAGDLDRAVVVSLDEQGKLRVQLRSDPTTHEGTAWARLWGSFLSLVLFVPVTERMTDAASQVAAAFGAPKSEASAARASVPDAMWWKEGLRISQEFLRDVGAMMGLGGSALFMLLQTSELGAVLRQLRNYGGSLLYTSLGPEQEKELRVVLGRF